jgi:hypothetical protein
MEGTDDPSNLVDLTPEEHYLAHLLLVKMYPKHNGLSWAAIQMTGHSTEFRTNNKLYGWLRRRHSTQAKCRIGPLNGSFGTRWITNGVSAKKVGSDFTLPDGWIYGRTFKQPRLLTR